MNIVTIVGAIGSEKNLTLYTQDGKTVTLPLNGWKTQAILEIVTPAMARNKPVQIDLDGYRAEAVVEKKTNGLVRFVRKIANVFGRKGNDTAITGQAEQLVAIVDGKEIPGMEALEKQIEHAARFDATGLANFMQRIAAVIGERDHEVHELLQFIKDGDLPIAADGSIIAYKKLYAGEGYGFPGWFVDPHTCKVAQREGSYVTMAYGLVDRSRRQECSAGLHIGRRSYMPSFSGDTIMLVKIAPEDVVCVPYGEPSKIRVMGYHIVAKLPPELYALVNSNKPVSQHEDGAKLLGQVVAGEHGPVNEIVEVRGHRGDDVQILTFTGKAEPTAITRVAATFALDDQTNVVTTPREIRERVQAERQAAQQDNVVSLAAATGDLSAALSTEAEARPNQQVVVVEEMTEMEREELADAMDEALADLEEEDEEPVYCDECGDEVEDGEDICCDCDTEMYHAQQAEETGCERCGEPATEQRTASDGDEPETLCMDCAMEADDGTLYEAPESAQEAEPIAPAAPTPDKGEDGLTQAQERALALFDEGKLSQRAIERETGVPVRTLKRIIAKRSA